MAVESPAQPLPRTNTATPVTLVAPFFKYADVILLVVLLGITGWTFLRYNMAQQPIPADTTYHIYAAQQMLEGHPIYRDVAIIKTPLADIVTLFALLPGRWAALDDTLSARLVFLLVGLGTVAVTYLAGRVLFGSRLVGVIAALIVGGNDFYGASMVTGPEPKALVVLCGFAALIFIARRHWIWAGIFAALAALAWQPALMLMAITLGAALVAPRVDGKGVSWKTRAYWMPALRAVVGMAAPMLAVGIYLGLNGALGAAYNATVNANLSHLNGETQGTPLRDVLEYNLGWIQQRLATYCLALGERWQLAAGGLGFVGILVAEGVMAVRQKRLPINLERTPFLLYTIGFIGFTILDFDFCPDLFPLLPSLALGIGWLVWMLVRGAGGLAGRVNARYAAAVTAGLGILAVVVIAWLGLPDAHNFKILGLTYADQVKAAERAKTYLRPASTMLSFGNAIALVELHRDNASKVIHLGSKSGKGVLDYEPGGVDAMIAALDQDPPRLITLSRINVQDWNQDFYDWVQQRYRLDAYDKLNDIRYYVIRR